MQKVQRGKKNSFKKHIRFLGVNAAGIASKLNSFKNTLNVLKPEVFFIEETKLKDEGKFDVENYNIFELVRKSRDGGGGLAIGCKRELQACWVREGNDKVEALSVDIFLKGFKIRCCVAYGCQESDSVDRKEAFWQYLNEEVDIADQTESGFILHFDGNLWAGEAIIPGDPRNQNRNGKLFQQFLEKNSNLTVVNSLSLCQGLITRRRIKSDKLEESVIDFFLVCNRVLPHVRKMVIDEDKNFILTNYKKAKFGGKATDSDHFTQYMDIELEIENIKPEKNEIYNFKNKESQKMFQQITSETTEFTECFKTNAPLNCQIENWRKLLKSYCYKAFPKIKVKRKRKIQVNQEISKLIQRKNLIKSEFCKKCTINNEFECQFCGKNTSKTKDQIEFIDRQISNLEAEENRRKILENFKHYSDNPEQINMGKMWKLLKKIWPKHKSISTAKRNHIGKIISRPKEIKILMSKEYKERLRRRPIRPDMKELMEKRQNIFQYKLKIAKNNKSPEWNMKDLDIALAKLKNNKSRDFEGLSNELFKNNIGTDLKKSLLLMFNKIKSQMFVPKFMNCANITTVPKKGSQIELKNERGIFRVSVIRSILMNLIYESKYSDIDKNMSECQMGGRRKKGCKNNIFILNGIIHEAIKSKQRNSIVLQFYDYSQMFDSIDLKEAITDMFNTGMNDDNLVILYKANHEINMAVKTAHGISDREMVNDIVLQGDKFGSLMASVIVDKIGIESMENGNYYMYKNVLPIGFMGMVDDIVGISEAGHKASELNAFINVRTAEKSLQFGPDKCKYMIVGKCNDTIIQEKLHVDHWNVKHKENNSTGEHELIETYTGKVDIERTEEYKYLGFVISSTGSNLVNIRHVKKKSIGIIRNLFSKLASLNLKQYYFECGIILMNVMLRGSTLYASDMYYNLKENELRQIERIDEGYLRKLLKTTRGCPITSLYLETGQMPARFEIMKLRLLYLKNILEQPEESKVKQMLKAQTEKPLSGDWASTCLKDIEKLKLDLTFEEIRKMTKKKYTIMIKESVREVALKYLLEKQGKKDKEIRYSSLDMAEYLHPFNNCLSIDEKCQLFAVRNRMVNIPNNFSSKCDFKCVCGKMEDMKHIYICEKLNGQKQPILQYDKIFNGNLNEQIEVYRKFEQNLSKREQLKETSNPCDLGPLCISKG